MKKEAMEIEEKQKKERRRKARARRALIAVACLLIFLLSSLMAIPLSDHSSGILDHPLESLLHVLKGGSVPADPAPDGREEKSQTVRITDPEKIDAALQLMPQLFVPEYLPEGWEMESLEVTNNNEKSCVAHYIFTKKGQKLTINEYYGSNLHNSVPNTSEVVTLNGRTVYYCYDESAGNQWIVFFENNVIVHIDALLDKEVLLKIEDQMKPFEDIEN